MTIPYDPASFAKDRIEAAAALLGLDLSHQEQWDFLQQMISLDLQAAPGSGKTSLVGLKLALLAQGWRSATRGVCVISHTNTAKDEITARLDAVPAGRSLLHYPHFIGTIQSFVNTFLALPALRSMNVEIQTVDDDAYAAAAIRLLERPRYRVLKGTLERQRDGHQLISGARFVCEGSQLTVVTTRPLPFSADTNSGKQFDHLKRQLARAGVFRYDDMFAVAERHLLRNPTLADATATRFPFVLLDEMQDTSAMQQRLLDKIFNDAHTVVQRVGDINQRIFDDRGDTQTSTSAFPLPMSAELPVSRRFGSRIAALASEPHRPPPTAHRRRRARGQRYPAALRRGLRRPGGARLRAPGRLFGPAVPASAQSPGCWAPDDTRAALPSSPSSWPVTSPTSGSPAAARPAASSSRRPAPHRSGAGSVTAMRLSSSPGTRCVAPSGLVPQKLFPHLPVSTATPAQQADGSERC